MEEEERGERVVGERALALDQKKAAGFIDRATAESQFRLSAFAPLLLYVSRYFSCISPHIYTHSLRLLLRIYCPDESWLSFCLLAVPIAASSSVQLAAYSSSSTTLLHLFSILATFFFLWADSTLSTFYFFPSLLTWLFERRNVHNSVTLQLLLCPLFTTPKKWGMVVVVCVEHLYIESTSRRRDSRSTRPVSGVHS